MLITNKSIVKQTGQVQTLLFPSVILNNRLK